MDYLHTALWYNDGDKGHLEDGNAYDSLTAPRKSSTSSHPQRHTLLFPIARILKTSAGVVNSAVLQIRDGLTEEQRVTRQKREERSQILYLHLKNAQNVDDWKAAAQELDLIEGNEAWKFENESDHFDAPLIESRLKELDNARIDCDVNRMLYLVRTAISRDLGGMGEIKLYKHSHIGTKNLIERYIDSTLETIKALVRMSEHALPMGIETKDILEQVVCARQAFGRSALLLSGGATFGMNHVGVLKALFEARLLPRIISGASAGSIVCAVLCTRTDEEIPEVLKAFPHGDLAVFEDANREDGLLERIGRFLTQGAWIDMKHLIRVMQDLLGDMTFQEAYNRTRRILNICVSSASVYELPRLLNYVTSPNVMIWSAVAASCSVPFLFSAAHLLVKNPGTGEHFPWNPTPQRWIDGSVDNDLPMTRLAEMFNVNHFIVSQVNPHVVPFLAKDDQAITKSANASFTTATDWLYTVTNLAKGEALHRMGVLADLGIFPNLVTKARSVLSQKYSGDITILPEINYRDFPRMLKNPTSDFMVQACLCGERATWPKLSRIRNHCAVELALDSAVQQLRARVVFSPSQVDLRRMGSTFTGREVQAASSNIEYKRRVSGSNASGVSAPNNQDATQPQTRSPSTRPAPIRTYSTQWSSARPTLPPLSTHYSMDSSTVPSKTQIKTRPKPQLRLHFNDLSGTSEAETTSGDRGGYASSDADVDSHTDDSSPDSIMTERRATTKTSAFSPGQASFFTTSQPATPFLQSLSLNATTPPSGAPSRSPELVMTRERGLNFRGSDGVVTAPSSPERRYKRLFHPGL